MNEYKLKFLKNKLPFIIVPMKGAPSASVFLLVRAGGRFEHKNNNGLAHFLEHMAFKGTTSRPTTLDIASEIDSVGGEFNAYTSREEICYYVKTAATKIELSFDILSDMLQKSLFRQEEIEREKGVIIEELNMYEDMPERKSIENFERLLYGDTSMGWQLIGPKENILKFKRNDFLAYQKQFFTAGNMVLVAAGRIDEEKAVVLGEKYFGRFKKGVKKRPAKINLEQKHASVFLVNKKTEQAHLALGLPTVSLNSPDKDYYSHLLMSAILGGSMSSRLFIEIRERRGLAYYVRTIPEAYSDSGFLAVWAGVRLKAIDEAIKISVNELFKLTSQPVSDRELKKTKDMVKGRAVLSLENSRNVAERYATQQLIGRKIRTPKETFAKIDEITVEDIQKLAKRLFKPEKLNLSLVGPFRNSDKFKNLLKF